ncbi:MAG: LytTR family transcriptional regulator DNA-binding domain-containing protein [Bacteroides sp.]|nr:LytTR family transcriptional regulator DNA-binding domain-containing protein [Bacteroides sp.]
MEKENEEESRHFSVEKASSLIIPGSQEEGGVLQRIPVKDGTRIHLIPVEELHYIEACGDYVTLFTKSGQYVKEQTMKYFESHLPEKEFVRIHRLYIIAAGQILRIELFGKESYQVRLKNGVSLLASNGGYKLLKQRLEL